MDPITRAMARFASDAEAFWRAHPGRLLPLVAGDDDRAWVLQALRLREAAPDNRRPFVIHEPPFEATSTYFAALAEHIAEHYERVREGVVEEGVELPPFASDEGTVPSGALKRAAIAADRAARLLGEGFDGIVIALVPERVADVAAWRESVLVLASARWSPRVRIAVLAPPGGALAGVVGSEGARMEIHAGDLLGAASRTDSEPGEDEASTRLRALMLDAATKSASGDTDAAVASYRHAAALCAAERMPLAGVGVWMILGGVLVAAERTELALESYSEAAGLAMSHEAWPLACQAWLGVGGAHTARGSDAAAVLAFQAAADAARSGAIPVLEIEALRLMGSCLLRLGREDAAARAWQQALDVGASLGDEARRASTFEEVAGLLAGLLDRRGLGEQAGNVRKLVRDGAAPGNEEPWG